jgi:hypothetical protein
MKPEITLIKKSGPNPIMSKRIFLEEQGNVCIDGSQCLMAQGTATRAKAETAAELAKHIMVCGTDPYNVADACSTVRIGRTLLYEAIRTGALREVKRGRRTLILHRDLLHWVQFLPPMVVKTTDEEESNHG